MKKHTKAKRFLAVALSVLMLMSVMPFAGLPVGSALSTAEASLTDYNVNNLNHSITYTHGKFAGDSSGNNSESQYMEQWKGVIWTDGVVKNYNDSSTYSFDSGWKTTSSGWNGGNQIAEHFYNHSAVVLYDGESDMKLPVAIMSCASAWGAYASWGRLGACYLRNSDGISLETRWRTPNNQDDNTLDVQWLLRTQSPLIAIQDKGNSWRNYDDGTGHWHQQSQGGHKFYATRLSFPTLADSVYSKKFTLSYTYAHATGTNDVLTKVNGSSTNDPIYMVNYKVVKNALADAKTTLAGYKTDINAHPGKYTTASINAFVNALNLLSAANPSSFIKSNVSKSSIETAVNNYATAAKKAVDAWNAAKTLTVAEYNIKFVNSYNNNTISTATYKYGETPVAPGFQLTKNTDGVRHSASYQWNPAVSSVTGETTYSQIVTNWVNCTFADKSVDKAATCRETGLKTQECTICGNIKSNVQIPRNPDNHTGGTYTSGAVEPNCYQDGKEANTYCNGCNAKLADGAVIPATGEHSWDNGSQTKVPTWNEDGVMTYTCTVSGCSATKTEAIPKLGDTKAPVGTVTFRGYVYGNDSVITSIINRGFEENPSFDLFPQAGSTVRTAITDPDSGVASTEYFIADRVYTLEEVRAKADGWTAVTSNRIDLPLNTEGTFVVYVKASDNAGNVAYFSAPGYSVDKTNPVVTLPESENNVFCVSASVTVSDANLKTVTLDGTEVELADGKLAVTAPGEHTVVATDKVGNETTVTFTVNESHRGGTATCKTQAVCDLCGESYGELNKGNHEGPLTDVPEKAATCTEDGYSAHQHCEACGDDIDKEVIPSLGGEHDYAYRKTGNRKHEKYCTKCFATFGEDSCDGGFVRRESGSCLIGGYDVYKCNTCGNEYQVDNGTPARGHIYAGGEKTFNWTKTDDGYTCSVGFGCANCDYVEFVDATVNKSETPASCTEKGTITYTANASLSYEINNSGYNVPMTETASDTKTFDGEPASGHEWGEVNFVWADDFTCTATRTCARGCVDTAEVEVTDEVTTPATCTAEGVRTYTATAKFTDGTTKTNTTTAPIAKLDHVFTDYVSDGNATCTADGTKTATCDKCGVATDTITDVGSQLDHDWGEVVFSWAEDGSSCSATRTCKNSCGETEDFDVAITHKTTTTATCSVAEVVTYTATITVDGAKVTNTLEVTGEKNLNNHNYEETGRTPATCTTDEVISYVCKDCAASKTEIGQKALGHVWGEEANFTWTATETGFTATATKHCERGCDETVNAVVTETSRTEATCTEKGKVVYTATATFADNTVKTAKNEVELDALNHAWSDKVTFNWADDFTCTATRVCTNDETHVDTAEVEVTNKITTQPTCTAEGVRTYTATAVFEDNTTKTDTTTETVANLGHSFTNYVSDGNATCTADGTKTAKCDRCDETDTIADEGSKLGHSFTNYVSNDDASCTKNATETAKCDRCDETDTREIADSMLPHSHTKWTHIDGTKTHKSVCDVCGEDEKIADCTPGEWITDKEATYTEDGLKHTECTVCGATVETEKIPALSHHWGNVKLVWADDYSTCKAVRSCTDDGCTEKQEFEATVTSKVTTTATCEVNEVVTYTATVTVDGTEYTDSKEVTGDKAPHTEIEIPAVAATCDKAGSTAGVKCSVCGTVITAPQPTEALGHSFTNYVSDNNATCEADGTETATCDRCDKTDTRTVVGSKLDHVFTSYVADGNATCKADGTKTATCDLCHKAKDTVTDEGSKLAHVFTSYVSDGNATCKADGTKTATCDLCHEAKDTVADEGSKLAHAFTSYVSDGNATCTADGTKTAICDLCHEAKDTVADEGSKLDHSFSDWTVTEPATCQKAGTESRTCSGCGKTETREIAKLDHSFGEWTVTEPATCQKAGTESRTCSGCGKTETREIAKLDHTFGEWTVTDPATCQKAGTESRTCSGCGKTETREIAKLAHTFGEWTVTEPATCQKAGTESRTCSACNETETREITKLAHTEQVVPGYAATCGKTGLTDGIVCTVCGDIIKAQEVIPATGKHQDNDNDDICDNCGEKITHTHKDKDGDGKCDQCGHDMSVHTDGCICHKNNIFSKILRLICTILTKICHKRVACCPDMEYFDGRIKDLT